MIFAGQYIGIIILIFGTRHHVDTFPLILYCLITASSLTALIVEHSDIHLSLTYLPIPHPYLIIQSIKIHILLLITITVIIRTVILSILCC